MAEAFQAVNSSWKLKGRWTPDEIVSVVGDEPREREVDLPDEDPFRICVDHPPHLGNDLSDLGLVGRVELAGND